MFKKIIMCAIMLTLSLPLMARAEFEAGDVELTMSGSGTSDKDFRTSAITGQLSLGYFITRAFEASVRQSVSYTDPDDKVILNGTSRLALDLHLPLARLQPFIGANIGYIYGDLVRDQFVGGPEGGLKFFLNETTFAFGQLEYQFFFEKAKQADEAFRNGRFVYSVGLGVKF